MEIILFLIALSIPAILQLFLYPSKGNKKKRFLNQFIETILEVFS